MIDIAREWWRGIWQGLLAGTVIIGLAALAYGAAPSRIADRQDARDFVCSNAEEWLPADGGIDLESSLPFVIPSGDPTMPGPGGDKDGNACQPKSCSFTCSGGPCSAGPCAAGYKASCQCGGSGSCIGVCMPCGR